jgi:hypothetical protein
MQSSSAVCPCCCPVCYYLDHPRKSQQHSLVLVPIQWWWFLHVLFCSPIFVLRNLSSTIGLEPPKFPIIQCCWRGTKLSKHNTRNKIWLIRSMKIVVNQVMSYQTTQINKSFPQTPFSLQNCFPQSTYYYYYYYYYY